MNSHFKNVLTFSHLLKVKFGADPSRNLYNTYQSTAKGLGLSYHTNIKA